MREVGPRDGFQNEKEVIATAEKVALIDALARTGLRRLEVTSFVRADVIPQLADAEAVLEAIDVPAEVAVSVLVPNERGLEGALRQRERIDEINVFLSASETPQPSQRQPHCRRVAAGLTRVLDLARAQGLRCEGVISTSFGCPVRGPRAGRAGARRSRVRCATRVPRRSASATRPAWPTPARCARSSSALAPSSATPSS